MVTKDEIDGSNKMNSLSNKVFNVLYLENFSINMGTDFFSYYFKFKFIVITYMKILPTFNVCEPNICILQMSEERISSRGTVFMNYYEPMCGSCKANLDPSQEQLVLLVTEPSLQPYTLPKLLWNKDSWIQKGHKSFHHKINIHDITIEDYLSTMSITHIMSILYNLYKYAWSNYNCISINAYG